MYGEMISCRLDKSRNERCIYDERGWKVIVSAMVSFLWEGLKINSEDSSVWKKEVSKFMQKVYYNRRVCVTK